MATQIPEDIEAYKKQKIQQFTPPNKAQLLYKRLLSWQGGAFIVVLWTLVCVWLYKWGFDLLSFPPERLTGLPRVGFSLYFSLMATMIFIIAPVYMLLSALRRTPGAWRHYGLADFLDYYDYKVPAIAAEVRRVRAALPEAEFEVEVLQAEPFAIGDVLGVILYQTLDELGAVPPYAKEGGKPLLVLNGQGGTEMFNEKSAFAF